MFKTDMKSSIWYQKRSNLLKLYNFIILFIILTFKGMSWYNNDWTTYGINLLARIGEYKNYFVAQSAASHITPQFFTDYLVIGILKLVPSYSFAVFFLFLVSCFILISGILALSKSLSSKYTISCGVLLVIYMINNTIGSNISANLLWGNTLIHAYFATSFCIWALYFIVGDEKRFHLAYGMCVIAAMIQIQIGFYFGGCILLFQLIYSLCYKKKFKIRDFSIWLIPMLFLFLLFNYDSDRILSNYEFVEIYGRLRHSHHMIPSSWNVEGYLSFTLFIISIIILSYVKLYRTGRKRDIHIWLVVCSVSTFLALLINYIFTDIYPLAFVVKLQPARMVSILLLVVSVILIDLIIQFIEEHEYITIVILVSLIFAYSLNYMSSVISFILLFYIIFFLLLSRSRFYSSFIRLGNFLIKLLIPTAAVTIFLLVLHKSTLTLISCYLLCSLCVLFMPEMKRVKVKMIAAVIPVIAYLLIMQSSSNFFSTNVDRSLFELSKRFKNITTDEAIYYADPLYSEYASIALYSSRSPVVFDKNVPIYDDAIIEWLNRLIEFGVVGNIDGKYSYIKSELTASEILNTAQKYNASFLIVKEGDVNEYVETKRVIIKDHEGPYYVLEIIEDDKATFLN